MVRLKDLVRQAVVTALTAVMSLIGMAVGSVVAQPAPAPDGWVKVCRTEPKSKKDLCQTVFDLRTAGGQFLASLSVVEATGEARKILRMIVPTGLLLQPGIKVQVDGGKPEEAKFGICLPDGCVAELSTNDQFLQNMKKGSTLILAAQNQQAAPLNFNFPLATFKGSQEGKPLDEAALKARQEAIAAEIATKSKGIEDQIRDAQKKAVEKQQ